MSTSTASTSGPSTRGKRRRQEQSLVQDSDLWWIDGNIIVAAVEEKEDASITYGFRVHQSLLANHSTVFHDLFTLPQSSDVETYEGIPVVTLTDPYADVKGLLRLFYEPTRIPAPKKQLVNWKNDLDVIEGPLRLAAKYDLVAFHDRLASVLETHWPTMLSNWDERSQAFLDWTAHTKQYKSPPAQVRRDDLDLPRVINLANDAQIKSVLPLALFELHVATSLDFPFAFMNLYNKNEMVEDSASSMLQKLDSIGREHYYHLVQGREWLRTATTHLVSLVLPGILFSANECAAFRVDNIGCYPAVDEWWNREMRSPPTYHMLPVDPFTTLKSLKPRDNRPTLVCCSCRARIAAMLDACRQFLWDGLPYFFGIKSPTEGKTHGYKSYMQEFNLPD